ncbi:MAG: four helix bundle protein [Candidatus Omnitrophica bacterium]|nr:four helix bundle protein [Candidatus Omnitrophota bacterium]
MALYSELPLYKTSYDLFLEVFKLVKEFNREYKYTIGENLKKEIINLVVLIYRANCKENKEKVLVKAREKIEVIRLMIRLTKDLHQINTKKFVQVNKRIESVSKQLTGWQKSIKK